MPIGNFIWAKQMGGIFSSDRGNSIAVDASGNVYTTGLFVLTGDFDPGPGFANLAAPDDNAIFVSKLDALGNFVWAKQLGGTSFITGFIGTGVGHSIAGSNDITLQTSIPGCIDEITQTIANVKKKNLKMGLKKRWGYQKSFG